MEDSGGDRAAAFRFGTPPGGTQSIDYGTSVAAAFPWQPTDLFWDTNSWYRLTMRLDYESKTYDFAVNGAQINAEAIPFYSAASDFFAQVRIFRGQSQAGMIVDDLVVIPEPAAALSLLVGGSVLLLRRRLC
jgi:hypothetical protein